MQLVPSSRHGQLQSRSAFVRPSNLTLTTILQTLSIMRHISRASGGRLTGFFCPRSAETQRLLNFSNVTLESPNDMHKLRRSRQALEMQIPLRATLDRAALLLEQSGRNQGVGLPEAAALVGLRLDLSGSGPGALPSSLLPKDDQSKTRASDADLILAESDPISGEEFSIDLKIEPAEFIPEKSFGRPGLEGLGKDEQARLQRAVDTFFAKK